MADVAVDVVCGGYVASEGVYAAAAAVYGSAAVEVSGCDSSGKVVGSADGAAESGEGTGASAVVDD